MVKHETQVNINTQAQEVQEVVDMTEAQTNAQPRKKTRKWAVVHEIHIRVPHEYIPKLVITDVPIDVEGHELRYLIDSAGYYFGEFGVRWANHRLWPSKEWPAEVIGAWRRGDVEVVSYDELVRLSRVDDDDDDE